MAANYKIRFRSFLPGAGHDSAGNPRQGKTRVVGEVAVTSYEEGEVLRPSDVGLTNIDHLDIRVCDTVKSANGRLQREAAYTKGVEQFYLFDVDGAGAKTQVANGSTETLEFVAEGDSAHDVELL